MSLEKSIMVLGGTMVIVSVLLTQLHNPLWMWFTVFIGFNMIQSSFTGFCPPAYLLKKLGVKTEAQKILEQPSS